MKELVIDGNKWLRGGISRLRDEQGNMCVLGFYGLAVGVPEHCLVQCASTTSLARAFPDEVAKIPDELNCAVTPNDDPDISDVKRCHDIQGIFTRVGTTVVFVNVPGVSP